MHLNRKRTSKQEKFTILKEHFDQGTSLSELARRYQIHPVTLYNWKRQMGQNEDQINASEILSELEKIKNENNHLKKALADISLKHEILQEANEFLKKIPGTLVETTKKFLGEVKGRFFKKDVCRVLGVHHLITKKMFFFAFT